MMKENVFIEMQMNDMHENTDAHCVRHYGVAVVETVDLKAFCLDSESSYCSVLK